MSQFRFQYLERPSQFGGQQCVHSQWDERKCPQEDECQLQEDHCGDMFACEPAGKYFCLPFFLHVSTRCVC